METWNKKSFNAKNINSDDGADNYDDDDGVT